MASRLSRLGLVAAAVMAAGVTVASTSAQADWRHGHRYRGGDVAAGLIGGLALGAIAGGALATGSRPAYGYDALPPPPPRYRPVPVYAEPRYVYEERPAYCEIRRQKVWLDSWTYEVRRVRVCD
jgi:acyl-homoserine lactone acylase PvdQ